MPQDDRYYAILIHGFLGSTQDMEDIEIRLKREGYHTVNIGYDTFDGGVKTLADEVFPRAIEACKDAKRIDILTHSMGGLIVRSWLARHEMPRLKRIVMFSPPNQGSEVADKMSEYGWYRLTFGQAGQDLRTQADIPAFDSSKAELGVIAGTASWNPVSTDWIPGCDDGWVGVESTKIDGMADHISVPASHGMITDNESAIDQACYFLHHGHFASNIEMEGAVVDVQSFEHPDRIKKAQEKYFKDWVEKWGQEEPSEESGSVSEARRFVKGQLIDFAKRYRDWKKGLEKGEDEAEKDVS